MDEEDLASAADAERLQTSNAFSGLGWTESDGRRRDLLMDVLRTEGETMGVKLLRKMGWRDGQGVGPKVRRKARLGGEDGDGDGGGGNEESHWFAPEDSPLITFAVKSDYKGLGYQGEARLGAAAAEGTTQPGRQDGSDDEDASATTMRPTLRPKGSAKGLNSSKSKGGFGVGILNDTGSDDEDPYEIGPRISYNRVLGGAGNQLKKNKKKNKAKPPEKPRLGASAANPLLASKPVFISSKAAALSTSAGFRRCHDGRLPLDGFVLATEPDEFMSSSGAEQDRRYAPPPVPEGWKPSKQQPSASSSQAPPPPPPPPAAEYRSVADAAKASALDPAARASLLGEAPLPGKSVFDFLSPAARDRIASVSGRSDLPAGMGETAPKGFASSSGSSEEARRRQLLDLVPELERDVALKALGRGVGGWMPYAEDEAKRARYRAFLEHRAGLRREPCCAPDVPVHEWAKELHEFAHAAQMFKPMTGMMASRFTPAAPQAQATSLDDASTDASVSAAAMLPPSLPSASSSSSASQASADNSLLRTPAVKPVDAAEAAAKVGMYGPMTRSAQQFYPTRLLCKRFNVRPPVHVQPDSELAFGAGSSSSSTTTTTTSGTSGSSGNKSGASTTLPTKSLELVSNATVRQMLRESGAAFGPAAAAALDAAATPPPNGGAKAADNAGAVVIDTEHNPALEAKRPGEEVFRAIFGSDDDDDDG
jgi:G patch domain-containing protein 1